MSQMNTALPRVRPERRTNPSPPIENLFRYIASVAQRQSNSMVRSRSWVQFPPLAFAKRKTKYMSQERLINLKCTVCNRINYSVKKSKGKDPKEGKKLELKKFCQWCRKHTVHKESKIKGK